MFLKEMTVRYCSSALEFFFVCFLGLLLTLRFLFMVFREEETEKMGS